MLGIGGNDVLRKVPSDVTKDNITKIINQLQDKNIPVILIAEPHIRASALFGKASDNPIYQELANRHNVPLLSNVWSDILSDNRLKSDQIHANVDGYALFADKLYEFLKEQSFV